MEIKGKVIAILPKKSGVSARTGNTWATQEFVIETPGQYHKKVCLQVYGEDRINLFNIQGGEDLTVKFDIDAHEYNGKWFNSLNAYDIVREDQQQPAPQPAQTAAPSPAAPQQPDMFNQPAPFPVAEDQNNNDDLPF